MHKRLAGRFAALAVCLFTFSMMVAPQQAWAHAVLVSSTPLKNSAVSGPDINISLKYNSRVDGGRSAFSLLKPDGKVERLSGLMQPEPDVLTATGHASAKGAYVLRWQVLSSDGHITRGELPFHVR